ncbi:MAG: hypothetical protein OXC37_05535 [Bdellovibrionaceae bacterium]|nr:hypothetical protein [Pseudobdellovibrionaceae bacterium]
MKQQIKVFFLLFFSPFIVAEAYKDKEVSKQADFKFFYKDRTFLPLKKLNFFRKDSRYYVKSFSSDSEFVASEEFRGFLPQWFDYKLKIDQKLSKFFFRSPYFRKNYLLFLSPRYQLSNASAGVYPFSVVKIYSFSSTDFMDHLSLFSWSRDSLTHELSHIYQMSQNSNWDRILAPILGSLSYRNMFLPSWILEGHAILMESFYGSGGRLFSGFVRAFVFSQIKKDFSLKRLLKAYDDSFSSTEKYFHGAYFFNFLYSQYGSEKIKKFFHESGRFLPLDYYGLNSSLKRAFKKDLLTLFKEYKTYYKDLAQQQKVSSQKALLTSKVYVPINSNDQFIYFLISDSKTPPYLVIFDKQTGIIKKTKKNLPIGKIFYRKGKYYSSANLKTSATSFEYTLFKENFKNLKKYNSQNVMDFFQDKAISLDSKQSHLGNSLIIDKVFYTTVDSSVLADSKGTVYYFKQNKDERTLYKNKQALISFKSYFSYPLEVNEIEVYFIGATKYGSSLFVYKKDQGIYRLSESDRIVSARKIKDDYFLVSEISPTHYEYKIIKTKEKVEKPFLYAYSFQKENSFLDLKKDPKHEIQKNNFNSKDSIVGVKLKDQSSLESLSSNSFKPYNAFKELYLKQFLFIYEPKFLRGHSDFFSSFSFLDPLKFNELSLSNRFSLNNKFINTIYSFQKYRPSFKFSFLYDESRLDLEKSNYEIQTSKFIGFLDTEDIFYPVGNFLMKKKALFKRNWVFNLTLNYPIYINPKSNLIFKSQWGWGEIEFNKNKNWKTYLTQSGQLKYQYKIKYPHAYFYYKKRKKRT